MGRIRITILDTGDRTEDLKLAARIRQEVSANSPAMANSDSPLRGTHRDVEGRAYFEYATDSPDDVKKTLQDRGFEGRVSLDEHPDRLGHECANCGNRAGPYLPDVCPNCGFRDITPCPVCREKVSREEYIRLTSDLFRCPRCQQRVRLRFNEPMFEPDGLLRPPLVIVEEAGG